MRIDELTRPQFNNEFHPILQKGGWEEIGSGNNANVFGKPGVDYVLKVFIADDHAYRDYLDLISRHDNPHFPAIKGKLVKITPHIYAVRLEKLTPYRPVLIGGLSLTKLIQAYLRYGINASSAFPEMFTMYPRLRECLDLISDNLSDYNMDINPNNIMMRGDDLVIIDPVI